MKKECKHRLTAAHLSIYNIQKQLRIFSPSPSLYLTTVQKLPDAVHCSAVQCGPRGRPHGQGQHLRVVDSRVNTETQLKINVYKKTAYSHNTT